MGPPSSYLPVNTHVRASALPTPDISLILVHWKENGFMIVGKKKKTHKKTPHRFLKAVSWLSALSSRQAAICQVQGRPDTKAILAEDSPQNITVNKVKLLKEWKYFQCFLAKWPLQHFLLWFLFFWTEPKQRVSVQTGVQPRVHTVCACTHKCPITFACASLYVMLKLISSHQRGLSPTNQNTPPSTLTHLEYTQRLRSQDQCNLCQSTYVHTNACWYN